MKLRSRPAGRGQIENTAELVGVDELDPDSTPNNNEPAEDDQDAVTIDIQLPTGACCANDGSCSESTQSDCESASGEYQGDGISCDPNPCPQPQADLELSKDVDVPEPVQGQDIAFSVAVVNQGPDDAHNIVVQDLLPAGLAFVFRGYLVGQL